MKAILASRTGGPEVLAIGDTPAPEIGPEEILVRVRATAVNRADTLQRRGLYPPPPGASDIIGLEMAGEVTAAGPACTRWRTGDRVFAVLSGGGYAQYAAVHERLAMAIPDNVDFESAAAIGEVFLTAYQAVYWLGEFQPGNAVLIHAGASGVGTAAIQLVKSDSGTAIVTAGSDRKLKACRDLGADAAVHYPTADFREATLAATDGRGADIIIDVVGAPYYDRNVGCIATDGRLVVLALLGGRRIPDFDLALLMQKRMKIIGSTLRSRSLDYRIALSETFAARCLHRFETGEWAPVIDRVLPWDRAGDAHAAMEANANIGKIVLKVT